MSERDADLSTRRILDGAAWRDFCDALKHAGSVILDERAPDDAFNRVIAFLEYKFSRRTRVFLELDPTRWKGNYIAAGGKSTSNGAALGITHSL